MKQDPSGRPLQALDTPALCLDVERLEHNIAQMAAFCQRHPANLRPHCKTHKCPTIAWMQIKAGAIGVTCAKLGEAEIMAQAGIEDILIANQIVGETKLARLVGLATSCHLTVAVDDLSNAGAISQAAEQAGAQLSALVEVDIGMGRCGVVPGPPAVRLAQQVDALPSLRFAGLQGYEGHAVMVPDPEARRQAAEEAIERLSATRDAIEATGLEVGILSGGGTGTYETTGAHPAMNELQAGSYATMDGRYASLGLPFACALTIQAQVISVPTSERAIIDAGIKTMTGEFGLPTVLSPAGWRITHLSEEHATLQRDGGGALALGERISLLPSHGCTTINLHDAYQVICDGRLEAVWPIAARGCVR